MKRFLVITVVVVVGLLGTAWIGLWAWGTSRHSAAAAEAIAAVGSDAQVTVEQAQYLVFRPASGAARSGVIFYPGANCDVRGYAPLLRRIAAAGYLVVGVPMPLGFAFLAPEAASGVQAAYPEIHGWAIIGHSLGGAMAANYVHRHPDRLQGLVVWDSYPPESASLADYDRPVWHIHRATPNGAPPPSFAERRHLFPPDSRWVPLPGGIHMYFGSFEPGGYQEDWQPLISRAEQQDLIVAATLEALAEMAVSH